MDIIVIVSLFIVSFLLFAVEVFLIPGFGLAGILSALGLVAANYFTFTFYGIETGIWVLFASILFCTIIIYWVSRSKTLDKYALKRTINSTAATSEQLSIKVGDRGFAVTRLALVGNAEIEGKTVEVKSASGFINQQEEVEVTKVEQAQITVKKISHN